MSPQVDPTSVIRRTFKGLSVQDARNDLRIFLTPDDTTEEGRKDPEHCVLARACRRQFSSSKVLFLRTLAYVDLPNEKGQRSVERFIFTPAARSLVARFDQGENIPAGTCIVLKAPSGSTGLDYSLEQKRQRKAERRKAIREGTYNPHPTKSAAAKLAAAGKAASAADAKSQQAKVRSGLGLIQQASARKDAHAPI